MLGRLQLYAGGGRICDWNLIGLARKGENCREKCDSRRYDSNVDIMIYLHIKTARPLFIPTLTKICPSLTCLSNARSASAATTSTHSFILTPSIWTMTTKSRIARSMVSPAPSTGGLRMGRRAPRHLPPIHTSVALLWKIYCGKMMLSAF